ncbi:MAG TPA: hypothetical protein VIU41_07405 [Geobacteraceae bacterium]
MEHGKDEYADLARQVQAVIKDNKRFLDRMLDDEFAPDQEDEQEEREELPVI